MTPNPTHIELPRSRWRTFFIWGVLVPFATLTLLAIAGFVYLLGFEHY